jgi:apolipoprotein N-acyltransferase
MVATERATSHRKNAELSMVAAVVGLVLPLLNSPPFRAAGLLALVVAVFLSVSAIRSNQRRGLAIAALGLSVVTVFVWIAVSMAILNTSS